MRRTSRRLMLIAIAAAVEAVTGIVLIADPPFVAWLLFGSTLPPMGAVVGRVAGFALLALGLACWPARGGTPNRAVTRGLLLYNALAALFFLFLGIGGEFVGLILWPAAILHGIFAILLARALVA